MAARSAVMVGRDAELSALREAFARAADGQAQVALITGEAGIGKTRLVREFVAELPEGTVVAFGHAVPLSGEAIPYGVVADLLRSLVRAVGSETVTQILGSRTHLLAPLVPALAPEVDVYADRSAVFAAAQDLLVELSSGRTLTMVVEDAHWVDESSLDLLVYLARTLVVGRIHLVLTARDRGVEGSVLERLSDLRRLPVAMHLVLRPLDETEVEQQVRAIAPDAGPDTVTEVRRLSAGIPLFVEELLSRSKDGPPEALKLDLAARMSRLSDPAASLLQLASLEARAFVTDLLAVVADRTVTEVDDLLLQAEAAGLVERSSRAWQFRHEMLRMACVDSLPPSRRAAGHRRWAEALTSRRSGRAHDLVAAADHADEGLDPEDALRMRVSAARACELVARDSATAGQWRSVLFQVWKGQCALPELEHEEALLGATGVRGWDTARAVAKSEQEAGKPMGDLRRIWVTLTLLNAGWSLDEPVAAIPSIVDLSDMLDTVGAAPATPFTFALCRLLSQTFRYLDRLDLADRAIDVALSHAARIPQLPPGATGWTFEERLANESHRSLDLDSYDAIVQEALAQIAPDDLESRGLMHARSAFVLQGRGQLEEAMAEAALASRLARGLELSGYTWVIAVGTAQELCWYLGRWDEALESQALVEVGGAWSRNVGILLSVMVRALRGIPITVETELARLEAPRLSSHDGSTGYATRFVPAMITAFACERSDPVRARDALLLPLADADLKLHELVPDLLTLASRLARSASADEAYVQAVREALTTGFDDTPFEDVFATMVLAELDWATGGSDPGTWQDLVRRCEAMPMPWFAALARLRLASMLLDHGDREVAHVLGPALATSESLGAWPLADDIRALAARARIRLPGHDQPANGDTGPLTAREHEVLQLLVQGMTNDQIGSALFMSPRTASVHVSHILQKLGAANRTEVAAVAHRRGLVTGEG